VTATLPYSFNLATPEILRLVADCSHSLGELKGIVASIPSEAVLIATLTLQEAKDSSEIENILTTHHDLYQGSLFQNSRFVSPAAKEVNDYSLALREGFSEVRSSGLIRLGTILRVQKIIGKNDAGIRSQSGTVVKEGSTGKTIYEPPQDRDEINRLLANLLDFINDDDLSEDHPLIKMALIHYQIEKIHPFYDGNGRTGRIVMMLYLVIKGMLDLPVLYLSRFITRTKDDYYGLLREEFCEETLANWVRYFLAGTHITALDTIRLINQIRIAMAEFKKTIRDRLPRVYSQDLLNNLFKYPYTKIEYLRSDVGISRPTASKYLNQIVDLGLLTKRKVGNSNYYINERLFGILTEESPVMQRLNNN